MGLCRFLLAMAVFADHVSTPKGILHLTGSQTAVEGFFVISGYLMALIQDQRKYNTRFAFWRSRFLRIFPIYWIILALSVLASVFITEYGRPYLRSSLEYAPLNVSLVGLDLIVLFTLVGGFTTTANIVVPQSWTLSLEIYFYLCVPWLSRMKTRTLAVMCTSILTLKLLLFFVFELQDPWSYRFFPLEIGFFLWGMLMYRLHLKVPKYSEYVVLVFWLFAGLYRWGSPIHNSASMIFPLLLGLTLGEFAKWDRFSVVRMLGKISYPLYLTHALVGTLVLIFLGRLDVSIGIWWRYILILACTLAVSVGLIRFVESPIDRVRAKLASRN